MDPQNFGAVRSPWSPISPIRLISPVSGGSAVARFLSWKGFFQRQAWRKAKASPAPKGFGLPHRNQFGFGFGWGLTWSKYFVSKWLEPKDPNFSTNFTGLGHTALVKPLFPSMSRGAMSLEWPLAPLLHHLLALHVCLVGQESGSKAAWPVSEGSCIPKA